MGYRSDVTIVTERSNEELIEACREAEPDNVSVYVVSLFDGYNEEIKEQIWKDVEVLKFVFEGRKWYDEYPNIRKINRAMSNLEEISSDSFGCIEIGEDISDVDYRGFPFDLGLDLIRRVSLHSSIIEVEEE